MKALRIAAWVLTSPVMAVIVVSVAIGSIMTYAMTGRWEDPIELIRKANRR